jgi:hypothetical protein
MRSPLFIFALEVMLLVAAFSRPALSEEAGEPLVLAPGRFRIAAAGGVASVDRAWTYATEISARGGISHNLELAGPLALCFALIDTGNGSGLVLGGGIVDAWISENGVVFWSPAVALAGRFRTSTTSSLRAAFDVTGAERDFASGEHPAWMRSAAAFLIDFGPYATIAMGASYQRLLAKEADVAEVRDLGWAGDARISLLSVRTEPFEELPLLAVHVCPALDLIAIVRIDIDMNVRTTDARTLVGLRLGLDARLTRTAF